MTLVSRTNIFRATAIEVESPFVCPYDDAGARRGSQDLRPPATKSSQDEVDVDSSARAQQPRSPPFPKGTSLGCVHSQFSCSSPKSVLSQRLRQRPRRKYC